MPKAGILPPLPPSDQEALDKNKFDGFYQVKARDFWRDAEINRMDDTPMKKCTHEFKTATDGVECEKCHFGLVANNIEIRNKKLFYKGEPIGL